MDSQRPPQRPTAAASSGTRAAPTRWRGWRVWMWVTLVVLALAGTALVLGVATLTSLSGVSVCGQPPDPAKVAHAQRSLTVLAGIAFAPWLLAAVWVRPRLRVLVAGALVSAPAWLSWLYGHFDPQVYTLTWCF